MSERRACKVARMNRATFRYRGHRDPRTELRMRIREIAQTRVWYGYRKIRLLLNREGWKVGKYLVRLIICNSCRQQHAACTSLRLEGRFLKTIAARTGHDRS